MVIGDFYVIFNVIFGDFLVGTWEPLPYCDKIPTFMSSSKANQVLVNFEKKLGLGQTPAPPPWAKFPTFTKNLFLELPLTPLLNSN